MDLSVLKQISQIQVQIIRYEEPVILVLGNLGNVANILIFGRRDLRKNVCSWYFICLSLSHLILLDLVCLSRIIITSTGDNVFQYISSLCKFRAYGFELSFNLARYFLCLVSIDRWMITSSSARLRQQSSIRLSQWLIITGVIFWAIFSMHAPIGYQPTALDCTAPLGSNYAFFVSIESIVISMGTMVIISVFSVLTVFNLHSRVNRQIHPTATNISIHIETQQTIMPNAQTAQQLFKRNMHLSPNGEYLLINTRRPLWNSNSFENNLWLYQTVERQQKLITDKLFAGIKYTWSPSGKWFFFVLKNNSAVNNLKFQYLSKIDLNVEQNIYLYSTENDEIKSISLGNDIPIAITWSQDDSSLYYATINLNSTDNSKWNDIIQYPLNPTCIIRHINIDIMLITDIANVPFLIGELLYSSIEEKLIFSTRSYIVDDIDILQIYSMDLKTVSSIIKLTNDSPLKQNLQLSLDKKKVLFLTVPTGSMNERANLTQQRLYSIDLTNGSIERWVADFQGNVISYTIKSDGGVYILGQLGITVQIYSQITPKNKSILHNGWNGSYPLISSSTTLVNSIAFVFTSFSKAEEAYFITDINQLKSAVPITNENNEYDQINLPECQVYQWKNNEDNQTIEGILHYPPGKFQKKNLPLLVLIHGGPGSASLNCFLGDWYNWAPMAAAEGWLVFEPNYRGSTGYGDQFTDEIRYQALIRPQKDILSGIDHLISDGIVDKTKLTIGGYSYGGILTNWIITQTNRFNAALSGAGSIEQVSFWGMTDMPIYIGELFGGFPWEIPETYQSQSPIYYFDQVRTPTHIVAGDIDIRVPFSQSLMLERAFRFLGIPVKLLLLPNEEHVLYKNPWHGKIKVREEIEWLRLYGYNSTIKDRK
ncbi:unnamed protein product, partial [Adineta steineri]